MVNDSANEEVKRVDISDKKVQDYLDALKRTHKITKKGYSDAITKLVELHEADEKLIRKLKRENEELSQNTHVPATPVIGPQPEALTESSSEITEPTAPIESVKVGGQQCYYYTFNPKKQKVECLRKYAKENVIDTFTQQICDYCWSLDPYKKYPIPNSQITDEQVSKEEPAPAQNSPSGEQKPESKPSSENEKWTPEQQKAIELAYKKAMFLLEMPQNPEKQSEEVERLKSEIEKLKLATGTSSTPQQPTIIYQDRIVEKPIYIEKIVEKIVYTDRRTGLEIPYFMSMANVEDELADRRERMAKTEEKCEQTRQKLRKMGFEEYHEWVGHPITQEEYHEMKGDVDT